MKAKKKLRRQARTVLAATASDSRFPIPDSLSSGKAALALSFIFPFAILGTVFALHGVFPFGNRQVLIHDFYQQSYPFLNGFWHKLREGAVSPWSWTAGAGHDYVAHIAYYLASPLNLLTVIVPHAWLREAMTVILLVKIGCAGLFTAMYLRYAYKEHGSTGPAVWALPVFSSLYALCAFTLGYYHNIVWFDSFALLPLVTMGLLALMREGKYRLYVAALALAIFTNFYIGYIICIFVALTFLSQCVMQRLSLRDFFHKLGLTAACSCLAAGLTAILTIPAWFAMQNIYSAPPLSPVMSLYTSFFDILGNFIAFTPPTVQEGLPNLYCGMISVLLAALFIQSQKIVLREKIALAGTFVFLFICLKIYALYIMMHGFRYPVGYPARFSFLISFVLVVMAYRAFLTESKTEDMDKPRHSWRRLSWQSLLATGICAALFLLSAVFGAQKKNYIIGSAVLCAFYILLFYFLMKAETVKARGFIKAVFFLVILTELSITSYIGVKTVGTSDRDEYYDGYGQIQALLNKRQKTGVDFYRTDTDIFYTLNEPYFYNYNGVSFFSSTINPDVLMFMQGLGLDGSRLAYNNFFYNATSPLTNAFLNMRYMISHRGDTADKNVYWEIIGKAGDSLLLENKYYLPLGFMADGELAGYKHHDNPFLSQNNLFRLATGIDGNLFEIINISALAENKRNITTWNYQVPVAGMLYALCMIYKPKTSAQMKIFINETGLPQFPMTDNRPLIFTVGNVAQDDNVSFFLDTDNASMYVGHLNSELFEQGYAKLAGQTLNLTKFANTQVCGNVTALEDGLLYTSIPADKNWNAYVDGVKSEIVLIDDAMIAVRLDKGFHEIEFRYFNKSLLAGIIVSIVSLGIFMTLVLLHIKKHRKEA